MMFFMSFAFNQDISGWDTSAVITMRVRGRASCPAPHCAGTWSEGRLAYIYLLHRYDAFGYIGTTFRELEWKIPIF